MPRFAWILLVLVTIGIAVAAVFLVVIPGPAGDSEQFVSENVKVFSPTIGSSVSSQFTVIGEARGWYFEASFPVEVRDPQNNIVAQTYAQAESDWMTADWVPFVSTVTVTNYSGPATLILMKDNPSGLPENDESVEFPIVILGQ